METAEEYVNNLIQTNVKINENTVPEIMVSFTKERITEILMRMGVDLLEIYWELEQIV